MELVLIFNIVCVSYTERNKNYWPVPFFFCLFNETCGGGRKFVSSVVVDQLVHYFVIIYAAAASSLSVWEYFLPPRMGSNILAENQSTQNKVEISQYWYDISIDAAQNCICFFYSNITCWFIKISDTFSCTTALHHPHVYIILLIFPTKM